MSFRVNVQEKRHWSVIQEEWVDGKRKDKRVPKSDLLTHGFRPEMTIEEAKARARQLNSQNALQKQDARRKTAALERRKQASRIMSAYLPERECEDFERVSLFKRFARNNPESPRYLKALSHWGYVQRMIADLTAKGLARDPSNWADEAADFYSYFVERSTSPKYVPKIIRMLNLWGAYQCKKHSKAFLEVDCPRGHDRGDIEDAYYKLKGRGKESEPLKPEMLEKARPHLTVPGQYAWLYVSLFF
jgi:hypothetical protein